MAIKMSLIGNFRFNRDLCKLEAVNNGCFGYNS